MSPEHFVEALADSAYPAVFNPWRDCCPIHDLPDAPQRRRGNLQRVLEAALASETRTMWIARDLGYRGGRRTGLPLTDEVHLARAGTLLGNVTLERATDGPVMAERTASVIWRVLERVAAPVVLWNVFPFHPHAENDPMSNRCHSRTERAAAWPLLEALIEMVQPGQIVAIGRDADMALTELGLETVAVRHPSYGGQAEFMAGIYDLYGVEGLDPIQPSLFPGGPMASAAA